MMKLANILEGPVGRRGVLAARRLARDAADGLVEMAWPTRCAICDMPGALLCDECANALPWIAQADSCPLCGAPYGRVACTGCWDRNGRIVRGFSHATCALEYTDDTARLVKCFKDQGELRLAELLASFIARALAEDGQLPHASFARDIQVAPHNGLRAAALPDAIVHIPASPAALARRRYDHMQLVAEALSELTGIEALEALRTRDTSDQRALGKAERMRNMQDAFDIALRSDMLEDRRILVVDDVFTTGSTLDGAACTLLEAGTADVRVATVCRVW